MMRNKIHILTFLVLTLYPAFIAAEDRSGVTTIETVIVTGERPEKIQTGDVDIESTPIPVIVIKKEDFEGKIEELPELIEKETGVQVRQTGGLGSFSTVSLRGSTSDQVMVFIDGILLNDASGGAVDLSTIALGDVEAIEIYKGATPGNLGNSSIGGAINIRTLRSEKKPHAAASVGYGSFNTKEARGYLCHKPNEWDYLVSLDAFAGDNDFEITNNNGTPLNNEDDRVETRNNAQFDQFNALGKFGYDLSKNSRLQFLTQWFSKDQGLPSWNNSPVTTASLETERNVNTLRYTHDDIQGSSLNFSTSLDYSKKVEMYDDTHGSIGLGNQKAKYATSRYGGNIYLEWLAVTQTLSLLLDAHHEDYGVENLLMYERPSNSTRDSYSASIQDTFYLFEDSLTLTPAVRYSLISDYLENTVDVWGEPGDSTSHDKDYFSPQMGIKYHPVIWLVFKSNLGKYFRIPHFYELSGDRGFLVGNPDLLPEEGMNFDIGGEINAIFNTNWLQSLSMSGTYFQSDVDNLISIAYDARGIGQAVNIPGAKIQGFEVGMKIDLLKYFKIIGNATLQDTKNLNENRAFNNKNLPGRWGQTYMGRIEAVHKSFKIFTEYIYNMDLYYDTANLLKAKDQEKLNAGLSVQIDPFLITLDIKNIQDRKHEDFNGYPSPGRSVFLMLTYKH
ncbi:MAG: TonB-dependent receptor [Deltaproteobacteria bacterium]|nr:TonB-dependent receptor [Deltaproteobacteria bacterium]